MAVFDVSGKDVSSLAADDVARVNADLLQEAVCRSVEQGWLLSFGSSRDGGATSVSILSDGGKERQWCSGVDELETALRAVIRAAGGGEWTPVQPEHPGPKNGPEGPLKAKSESSHL